MSRRHLHFCVAIVFVGGPLAFASVTTAQESQSSQSVAEAAARAKEAKKKASSKSKVLTEDDLAGKAAKAGEPTASPSGGAAASPTAAGADASQAPAKVDAPKENDPEVVRLKAQLADAEQDLDFAKREAALANDSYYSNPDHARDSAGKAKLDALQQQANDKQRIVQDLKDRLAAMGVKPSSAAPTAPPAPRS